MDAEDEVLSGSEGEQEEEKDCTDPETSSKYRTVAKLVNASLAEVVGAVQPGKRVSELCELGDNSLLTALGPLFNKPKDEKKIVKGLAFPTCISVNEAVCHNSPTEESTDQVLQVGDVVRIDIGGFLDGYSAVAAHTVVVQAEPQPITGKLADVVLAAQACIAVAVKSLRPGMKSSDVTELWEKVAAAYEVNICEGILSHQMKRFVVDGNSVIISKQTAEHKVDSDEFDHGQVWAIDIVISSGPGKLREGRNRPTVFKRNPDAQYLLKMKASRETWKEIQRRFPVYPFCLKHMSDLRAGRLGISECLAHDLVVPYPVLYEKAGEVVAHFKTTVLLTKSEIAQITGLPLTQQFESDKKIEDQTVLDQLKRGLRYNNKDKKKKVADPVEAAPTAV